MMNKESLPHIFTAVLFVVFIVLGLACASTQPSGQTGGSAYFPAGFIGTWKRYNYNNTITITANIINNP